jgi:hypothetical protein
MFLNRYRNLRRLQEVRKVETDFAQLSFAVAGIERAPAVAGLDKNLDSGVDGGEVVEFDNVGVS